MQHATVRRASAAHSWRRPTTRSVAGSRMQQPARSSTQPPSQPRRRRRSSTTRRVPKYACDTTGVVAAASSCMPWPSVMACTPSMTMTGSLHGAAASARSRTKLYTAAHARSTGATTSSGKHQRPSTRMGWYGVTSSPLPGSSHRSCTPPMQCVLTTQRTRAAPPSAVATIAPRFTASTRAVPPPAIATRPLPSKHGLLRL
mmetsp:Transcript_17433/g.61250  ORF Transcript_17433/g.61250 Transcript_17433/m.61250 type:complete len:201 (+) Transcript_17433:241-843(+)